MPASENEDRAPGGVDDGRGRLQTPGEPVGPGRLADARRPDQEERPDPDRPSLARTAPEGVPGRLRRRGHPGHLLMQRGRDLVGPVLGGNRHRRHIAQERAQALLLLLVLQMPQTVGLAPARCKGFRPAFDAKMVPIGKRPVPEQSGPAPQFPKVRPVETQRRRRRENLLPFPQIAEIGKQQAPFAQAGQEPRHALFDRSAVGVVLREVDQPDGMHRGRTPSGRALKSAFGIVAGLHKGVPAVEPGSAPSGSVTPRPEPF